MNVAIENEILSYINQSICSKEKLFYLRQTMFKGHTCYVAFLYNEEEYIVKINKIIIYEFVQQEYDGDVLKDDQYIKEQIIDLMPEGAHYRLAELLDPPERRIALTNFALLENSPMRRKHKAFCEDVNQEVDFKIDSYLDNNVGPFSCLGCIFLVLGKPDWEVGGLQDMYCRLGHEEGIVHSGCVDCPSFVSRDNDNSRLKFS